MKINLHRTVILIASVLFTSGLFAQDNGAIKGTITDQGMNNEPVLFANVQVKGIPRAFETNFHGNFEIDDLQPGNYTLIVSYLGYESQEVTVLVESNKISKVALGIKGLSLSMADSGLADQVLKTAEIPSTEERPKK